MLTVTKIARLKAVLGSGLLDDGAWRIWADRRMMEWPVVPVWLYDLSRATTENEALLALHDAWRDITEEPSTESLDETSIRLGCLYLQYLRGVISPAALLGAAGQLADARNYDNPECSILFGLQNEVEERGPSPPGAAPFSVRLEALFRAHADAARRALGEWAA